MGTTDRERAVIGLLREQDPAALLLPGGRRPSATEWRAHLRQSRDFILVALRGAAQKRAVVGSLELSIRPDPAGRRRAFGMIDRLYVAPSCRRAGLGSALVDAAIAFGRDRGLARLREHIPNLLRRDANTGRWLPCVPEGEGWGGLRSLGATANACAAARQPCEVAGIVRRDDAAAVTIGAFIEMPLGDAGRADAGAKRLRSDLLERTIRLVATDPPVPVAA